MNDFFPQLWLFDLRPYFSDGRWRQLLPLLDDKRRERALSCRREEDAARIAGAGALSSHALRVCGVPREQQQIYYDSFGRPVLSSGAISLSLSHAGRYAACALDTACVGVDVEMPRVTMAVAERFFSSEELSFLHTLSPAQRADALTRLWTAKEAYTKMLGRGLSVPFSSFCVVLQENGASLRKDGRPLPALLHEYRLEGGRVCLCCHAPRPEIRWFSPE